MFSGASRALTAEKAVDLLNKIAAFFFLRGNPVGIHGTRGLRRIIFAERLNRPLTI